MSPHSPSDSDSNARPALYFRYASSPPALDALDVRAVHPAELLGRPAALTVIGESHCVSLPALGFHELCSCAPLSGESAFEARLSVGAEREFGFEGVRVDAATVVSGRPLDDFPDPAGATVAYRFGSRAWTTISVTDAGYETYHTYPEHGLALYTETRLTVRGRGTADARTDADTDPTPAGVEPERPADHPP